MRTRTVRGMTGLAALVVALCGPSSPRCQEQRPPQSEEEILDIMQKRDDVQHVYRAPADPLAYVDQMELQGTAPKPGFSYARVDTRAVFFESMPFVRGFPFKGRQIIERFSLEVPRVDGTGYWRLNKDIPVIDYQEGPEGAVNFFDKPFVYVPVTAFERLSGVDGAARQYLIDNNVGFGELHTNPDHLREYVKILLESDAYATFAYGADNIYNTTLIEPSVRLLEPIGVPDQLEDIEEIVEKYGVEGYLEARDLARYTMAINKANAMVAHHNNLELTTNAEPTSLDELGAQGVTPNYFQGHKVLVYHVDMSGNDTDGEDQYFVIGFGFPDSNPYHIPSAYIRQPDGGLQR